MNDFNLHCPFPSSINPHVGLAQQRTLNWVVEHGLATPHSRTYKTLQVARFAWLAARTYPAGSLHHLTLISQWATWFFLHDDVCDAYIDPQALSAIDNRFCEVLQGSPVQQDDIPLAIALADLRDSYAEFASPAWQHHFTSSVQDCFKSLLWEAEGRYENRLADQQSYMHHRTFTGGAYTAFAWLLITEEIEPNAPFLRLPQIQELERKSANIIGWHNDIFSAEKEQGEGNPHNLVLILQREYNIELEVARRRAVNICNLEMLSFLRLADSIKSVTRKSPQAKAYVEGLSNWMRGHLDWMLGTARYAESQKVKV